MLPKLNQQIEIYDPESTKSYKSIIAGILDEQILIGHPTDQNELVILLTGTIIETHYIVNGNKYFFSTEIIGRRRDNIPLYILKKPDGNEIKKVQRREYIRVQTSLQVQYNEVMFHTIDISGGGLLLASKKQFDIQAGSVFKGNLFLPESDTAKPNSIPFEGKVLRVTADGAEKIDKVAIEFIQINEKNRQKIIQYCLRMQIRLKR